MSNYKINRNKPAPSGDQIDKHKDFGKLLDNHRKILKYKEATRPLYKNYKFMSFVIVLAVVLLTFIISENEEKQEESIRQDIVSDTLERKSGEISPNDTLTE